MRDLGRSKVRCHRKADQPRCEVVRRVQFPVGDAGEVCVPMDAAAIPEPEVDAVRAKASLDGLRLGDVSGKEKHI